MERTATDGVLAEQIGKSVAIDENAFEEAKRNVRGEES